MCAQASHRRETHDRSVNLNENENNTIIRYVENENGVTLSTAIVQLYKTNSPNHINWAKMHTGVLCFVKDYTKKSFFMRLFSLARGKLYEYKASKDIGYQKLTNSFHSFLTNEFVVGINFVTDSEANKFYTAIQTKACRITEKKTNDSRKVKSRLDPSDSRVKQTIMEILQELGVPISDESISMAIEFIESHGGLTLFEEQNKKQPENTNRPAFDLSQPLPKFIPKPPPKPLKHSITDTNKQKPLVNKNKPEARKSVYISSADSINIQNSTPGTPTTPVSSRFGAPPPAPPLPPTLPPSLSQQVSSINSTGFSVPPPAPPPPPSLISNTNTPIVATSPNASTKKTQNTNDSYINRSELLSQIRNFAKKKELKPTTTDKPELKPKPNTNQPTTMLEQLSEKLNSMRQFIDSDKSDQSEEEWGDDD